jgi:hypothetical protein
MGSYTGESELDDESFILDDSDYASLGNGWYRATLLYSLDPQPVRDLITITYVGSDGDDIIIDQISCDTCCIIPEPSTILLLATGGLLGLGVFFARRRRSNSA